MEMNGGGLLVNGGGLLVNGGGGLGVPNGGGEFQPNGGGEVELNVHRLSNYRFNVDPTPMHVVLYSMAQGYPYVPDLQAQFEENGMENTVDGVLLVHLNGSLAIILLDNGYYTYKLPGGKLNQGENEILGLVRTLNGTLNVLSTEEPNWQVGQRVSQWWRADFYSEMCPYRSPEMLAPKEHKNVYLVQLNPTRLFTVENGFKLVAVPLSDLFQNVEKYGRVIATVAEQISLIPLNIIEAQVGLEFDGEHLAGPPQLIEVLTWGENMNEDDDADV